MSFPCWKILYMVLQEPIVAAAENLFALQSPASISFSLQELLFQFQTKLGTVFVAFSAPALSAFLKCVPGIWPQHKVVSLIDDSQKISSLALGSAPSNVPVGFVIAFFGPKPLVFQWVGL